MANLGARGNLKKANHLNGRLLGRCSSLPIRTVMRSDNQSKAKRLQLEAGPENRAC
jgi:hypothetical protein